MNVVLERPLYDALGTLARREGTSLSMTARDLLRDGLELHEDLGLYRIAEERDRKFDSSKAVTHDEVWRRRPVRRAKKR